MNRFGLALPLVVACSSFACASNTERAETGSYGLDDAASLAGLSDGTAAAKAVLAVVNDRSLTSDDYVFRVRLARVTAEAILAVRNGVNGVDESTATELGGDDEEFTKLAEIDALPGTDEAAFRKLDAFARTRGGFGHRLALGTYHGCAIGPAGQLRCWGWNGWGQLEAPSGTFREVGTTSDFSCARDTSDKVTCWGARQVGYEWLQALKINAPTSTFQSIAPGGIHSCGLHADGTAECWGTNVYGQATPPNGIFKALVSGDAHTCGLTAGDTIACWGWDVSGQATPPAGVFKQISANYRTNCALRDDDTIACWGWNNTAQANPPSGRFTQVTSGVFHGCALRQDGEAACWGSNEEGQASPPHGPFVEIVAGYDFTCARRPNDVIACWGRNSAGQAPAEITF